MALPNGFVYYLCIDVLSYREIDKVKEKISGVFAGEIEVDVYYW